MLKKLSAMLLVLLLSFQLMPIKANALVSVNELKVSSELTQWTLDETTNTLYAISQSGKNLIFINATTMNIEKTLPLNGCPTDIIKDNGKLYISLDDINQIKIVDMATRTITKTLYTVTDPYRIVKEDEKIYYTKLDQWCNIYEYDLTTDKSRLLVDMSFSEPDIAINPNDHILYIGESGSSGSDMIYYSTTENKVISTSNYDNGYGFPYPLRNIQFDGINVYYAGRDFNKDNAQRFNGDFGNTENIVYINKGLVFTSKSIYDKDTHVKLGDYTQNMTLVESSDNTLFIYSKENGSIKRFNDPNKLIDSNSVISLISGMPATPIQEVEKSTPLSGNMSILAMNSKLIQWSLDEQSNSLYGISKDDKALFFVNSKTLNLEKAITFKCKPTDIIKDNDKLYIALDDANQIAIVDMVDRTIIETLYTTSDPYRIEIDGDKLYYTERDQWCNIYEYNITNKVDRRLPIETLYQPDIAINPTDHILYIGESGSSGSDLVYYNTISNTIIGKTYYNGYGFPYPGRYTLFDGEKVYYAGFDFDKLNPRILGNYNGGDIIFAKYGCVLTKTGLYDSNTYELINSNDGSIDLYEISDSFEMYFYSVEANAILKIDPNINAFLVAFDSQGGSDVEWVIVDPNTKVTAPNPPTREGYNFGGWYKEPECLNAWDFAKDLVTEDTMLYAKWTAKEDINQDGKVDILDIAQTAKKYNSAKGQIGWNSMYDLNNDGIVDIYDIVLIANQPSFIKSSSMPIRIDGTSSKTIMNFENNEQTKVLANLGKSILKTTRKLP